MEIIAHRGHWIGGLEKNSSPAFRRAFEMGFGVETDVRDCDGTLVISHDPPRCGALTFDDFLRLYLSIGNPSALALNIKADGLAEVVMAALVRCGIQNYFCFDMSVPDSRAYFAAGMAVYVRRSEYEGKSSLDAAARGFWLDAFVEPFVPAAQIVEAQNTGKAFCLVSPELHRKPHLDAWSAWFAAIDRSNPGVQGICTDLPEDASRFFSRTSS